MAQSGWMISGHIDCAFNRWLRFIMVRKILVNFVKEINSGEKKIRKFL